MTKIISLLSLAFVLAASSAVAATPAQDKKATAPASAEQAPADEKAAEEAPAADKSAEAAK
jgi:hypothetical protein